MTQTKQETRCYRCETPAEKIITVASHQADTRMIVYRVCFDHGVQLERMLIADGRNFTTTKIEHPRPAELPALTCGLITLDGTCPRAPLHGGH